MSRLLGATACLAACLVLVAATPVTAGEDGPGERGRAKDQEEHRGPTLGVFVAVAGSDTVAGKYVSFRWDASSIRNYTVNQTRLFDVEVSGAATGSSGGARASGSVIKVAAARYEAQAHDNPMGGLKVRADGPILLRLSPGTTAVMEDEHVRLVFPGGLAGRLFGDEDDLRIENDTVVAQDDIHFLLATPLASFDKERPALLRATAERKIGAEVSVGKGKDHDVLSYGNVTARVTHTPGEGGADLVVLVDGHGFDGRVIVLNVDGRLFGASKAEDLRIMFDNATTRAATDLADVLNPDDDGLEPEYWLGIDAQTGGFQLVVSVPHYSVHEIRVQSILAQPAVSVLIGVTAAILVVGASGFWLLRRPTK